MKKHYRINPETLQLERIEHGFRYWLRRSGGYIIGGVCLGVLFFYVFLYFFPSPREASLMQYNRNLSAQMEVLEKQVDQMQIVMADKDLKRMASGYGWRVDPVYHIRRFHEGMDFSAPVGTDIFATGDGVVTYSGWRQGYGETVEIDHGFNYATRYAHCSKRKVKVGQKVKRGDVIALVGNTGKSTGPHLHYEVHYMGRPIDPRNFYFYDLSPEEYDLMVQISSNMGNMMD